jgi:hypothetical protein
LRATMQQQRVVDDMTRLVAAASWRARRLRRRGRTRTDTAALVSFVPLWLTSLCLCGRS